MRGNDQAQASLYSYVSLESRVAKNHPLRRTREMVDEILSAMSADFAHLYSRVGRPSIAPERLLRALLLQIFYSIRSERMLVEQLDFNLLYRWFVGLGIDEPVWDATTFTKNRDRLLEGEVAGLFFEAVLRKARKLKLTSNEHFTVDGTIIEAWAGQKSFKKRRQDDDNDGKGHGGGDDDPGNPSVDFHGEKRTNDTHLSTSDPHARLFKKSRGTEAKLCYLGHVLMENRNGLVVDTRVTQATGTAEREAALEMAKQIATSGRKTLGGDKNYDTYQLAADLRAENITPHMARKKHSVLDERTTRHEGYEISQIKRKRVEEIFGWAKTVGLIRKVKLRGILKVEWLFTLALAAYNLVRIRNLTTQSTLGITSVLPFC